MKKLALALVVSALSINAASANISTGFYAGAAVGYGSTTGKFAAPSNAAGNAISGSAAFGDTAANIGIHGGYGWVSGCLYFGGEVAYTFENTKVKNDYNNSFGATTLKRNGYFNAALRGGYLFTPNTMAYVRLGANLGKWKVNSQVDANNTVTGSKNRLAFTPGVGLETAVHKNVYLRVEYNYEFGPSVAATNSAVQNVVKVGRIRTQSGKVGLSYKF